MNGVINLLPLAHSGLFFPDSLSSYTMLRAGQAQRMGHANYSEQDQEGTTGDGASIQQVRLRTNR